MAEWRDFYNFIVTTQPHEAVALPLGGRHLGPPDGIQVPFAVTEGSECALVAWGVFLHGGSFYLVWDRSFLMNV